VKKAWLIPITPGICTYCSVPFGTKIFFRCRTQWSWEIKEHFTPRAKHGTNETRNIVRACNICNAIKHVKDFSTGGEVQNYILNILLDSDFKILQYPTYATTRGPITTKIQQIKGCAEAASLADRLTEPQAGKTVPRALARVKLSPGGLGHRSGRFDYAAQAHDVATDSAPVASPASAASKLSSHITWKQLRRTNSKCIQDYKIKLFEKFLKKQNIDLETLKKILIKSLLFLLIPTITNANTAINNKIKNNLAKVELTISYLALKESYRLHDPIVVTSIAGKLHTISNKIANAGILWVEETRSFYIVFTEDTLKTASKKWLQFLAAHEVCHAIIHTEKIRRNEIVDYPKDDLDADNCAVELLHRHKVEVNKIWKKRRNNGITKRDSY